MNDKLIKQKCKAKYFTLAIAAAVSFIVLGVSMTSPVRAVSLDALSNPTIVTDVHLPGDHQQTKSVSCSNGNFCILISPSVVVPTGHDSVQKNNVQSCERGAKCGEIGQQNRLEGNEYVNSGVYETLHKAIRNDVTGQFTR
jgi:hypothetical protein